MRSFTSLKVARKEVAMKVEIEIDEVTERELRNLGYDEPETFAQAVSAAARLGIEAHLTHVTSIPESVEIAYARLVNPEGYS
jgi:hypothetical protein